MGYARVMGAGLTTPLKAIGAFLYGVEALVVGPDAMLAGALIQLGFSIRTRNCVCAVYFPRNIDASCAVCRNHSWHRYLGCDGFVRAPIRDPTMAARVAIMPLAGIFHCTSPVRFWPRNDPGLHPEVLQGASRARASPRQSTRGAVSVDLIRGRKVVRSFTSCAPG
jgi:hypothetical protein